MSDVKLPDWLEKRRDDEARELLEADSDFSPVSDYDFATGWNACYATLLERSPEFDVKQAIASCGLGDSEEFIPGARWQHAQDAAQIAAMKAEIEQRHKDVQWVAKKYYAEADEVYCQQIDTEKLKAEVERLRAALEKIADPSKRDHAEPDLYTRYGCVLHIAEEALK